MYPTCVGIILLLKVCFQVDCAVVQFLEVSPERASPVYSRQSPATTALRDSYFKGTITPQTEILDRKLGRELLAIGDLILMEAGISLSSITMFVRIDVYLYG